MFVHHIPVQIVLVIMMVGVYRHRLHAGLAEQFEIRWIVADLFRMAMAAHVLVEADHFVGGRHHQVQIVRHHQHATAMAVTNAGNEVVQLGLAFEIDTLGGFVEYQQLRLAEQRPRQQYALQLTAGKGLQAAVAQMIGTYFLQCSSDVGRSGARRQLQEALHTQRQSGIHLQALRHVADAQVGTAVDSAAAGHHQPESDLHQCGLAGTVGADERQDLALRQMQVYLLQDVAVTGMEIHRVQVQQGLWNAGGSSGGIGLGRRSRLVQDRVRGLANRWCIIAFNPARLCRYPMIYLVFSLCWTLSTLCRLSQRAVCALIVMLCASVSVAAPVVVVSIKPLQLIAAAVTDGISTPELAVGAGQDPHHLSLRPSERRALQNAELVLWAGPALEVPLVDVISDIDARVVTAQLLPGIQLGSIEGAIDPHLWLDSHNARHIATALATELQQLDTANADRYVFNVQQFSLQLDALDAELALSLQPLQTQPWSVSHDAFRYFTRQHGLQAPLTLADSSNNAPGVRSVVALRAQLAAQDIHCLLTEPTENHQQLDALLSGSEISIVSADVLGVAIAPAADAYATLLRQLASALQHCMGERDE